MIKTSKTFLSTYGRFNIPMCNIAHVHVIDATNHLCKVVLGFLFIQRTSLFEHLSKASRIGELHENKELLIDEKVKVQLDGKGIVHHFHDEKLVFQLFNGVVAI